jgi:hypothetical protein
VDLVEDEVDQPLGPRLEDAERLQAPRKHHYACEPPRTRYSARLAQSGGGGRHSKKMKDCAKQKKETEEVRTNGCTEQWHTQHLI